MGVRGNARRKEVKKESGKLADETTRKEAKTAGLRGPFWLIRISHLQSTLECAQCSAHRLVIGSKYLARKKDLFVSL